MGLSHSEKESIKKELAVRLSEAPEVVKVVIFGSFINTKNPGDIDIAVFQNSDLPYLPLALKYRKKTRAIAKKIALDILPLKPDVQDSVIMEAITKGEVIYER